jgi:hypothetical protein
MSVVLLTQWVSPTLSLAANEELCFKPAEAKKVLLEIEFGQITSQKLLVVQKSYSTCKTITKNNDGIIKGLTQDKVDLTKVSDEFKKKYIDTSEQLNKITENQPSRLTWFGIGAATSVVVGIILAFLVRK